MEPLRLGFVGAGEMATFAVFPALHFAPIRLQAVCDVDEPSFGGLTQLLCSFCSGAYDERRGRDYDGPVHAYVLDFAVHHLDLARYRGGEVRKLSLFHHEREGRTGDGMALVEFAKAIREDREPIASIHDSVETMRLYQAIDDAVCQGRDGVIPL